MPPWRQKRKPVFLLQPHFQTQEVLGLHLAQMVLRRHLNVGPVVLGTVDRSYGGLAVRIGSSPGLTRKPGAVGINIGTLNGSGGSSSTTRLKLFHDLYTHALELPYVATPELAAVDSSAHAPLFHKDLVAPRQGFVFHGDMGRWDFGVRGAMRDIASALILPTPGQRAPPVSIRAALLSRGSSSGAGETKPSTVRSTTEGTTDQHDGATLHASASHRANRNLSLSTARAMVQASLCFAPQGDTMTSRRLFDALAAGCAQLKSKGADVLAYALTTF